MCRSQIDSTPTHSPNAWTKLAHFLAGNLSGGYLQDHRGIFKFRIRSLESKLDIGVCPIFSLVSQLQGRNSKIVSMILKVLSRRGFHRKFELIRLMCLGCRGVLSILAAAQLVIRALLYIFVRTCYCQLSI